MDFFAEARQKILIDSFYTALTGGPQGTSGIDSSTKPIELYAHDPLRYIGDMLAWLHSMTVGEQEALEVLFISQEGEDQNSILGGIEKGLKSEPWVGDDREDAAEFLGGWDARKGLMMLVDKDLETVCKPLKVRTGSQNNSVRNKSIALLTGVWFCDSLGSNKLLPATRIVPWRIGYQI